MLRKWAILLICAIGLSLSCTHKKETTQKSSIQAQQASVELREDFAKYYKEFDLNGSFVLYDLNQNKYIIYNESQANKRFTPASTFKILNSLIGLESGVIKDADHKFKWDGTKYDFELWNQDHTLRSAIKHSAVWYYRELARQVGREKMQKFVNAANYGNKDLTSPIDSFWLEGSLKISPIEQVKFLKNFYSNQLPFSQKNTAIVKDIILLEDSTRYKLYGKTGWGLQDSTNTGWFVGFLEQNNNVYFFANQIQAFNPDVDAFIHSRKSITKSILKELSLL